MRDPRNARRSNQSTIKETNHEYLLEGLMLKLQYFSYLMCRGNSLEKILMLGKTEGKRRKGRQRMRWLDSINGINGHEFEQAPGDSEAWGSLVCCSPWSQKELERTEVT